MVKSLLNLKSVNLSGAEINPIIEGGKGVSVSDGVSAGHFAACDTVGTFSGVNGKLLDKNDNEIPLIYNGRTRVERHNELMEHSIQAAICQAKIANDIASGRGRIHMNLLWEAAGTERIIHGVMEKAQGLIHGITCGAGMPYRLGPLAEKYKFYYYPIVSSMRAFRALWKRSYNKYSKYLGGIVYEDPWKAGGHNGLSNAENPHNPEDPYPRVVEIRKYMNEIGLNDVPLIMAGGVWHINEYKDWLDDQNIGKIAFQFGTRPIVTKENPAPIEWKKKLLMLKEGDVFLNKFSPTGFYSSAVNNDFIKELRARSERQVSYSNKPENGFASEITYGPRSRKLYVHPDDIENCENWMKSGFSELIKTPDDTVIFVTPESAAEINKDQVDCMGCLTACKFSNWYLNEEKKYTTGRKPDPRSFCIQKTLQNIVTSGDVENELMFAGHNAFQFANDDYYNNDFIPTTKELVERILSGR
ncbi:MAG: nitronate monooxygenase [Rickettsiales bacterium]|nr:nitronate monooxygenase [Rickettsiales bacterium]